jgi:Xaa-Pro dipeptidase
LDKKLRRGDAVVIDVSAAYRGYFGDLTKSFFYGEAPEEYKAARRSSQRPSTRFRKRPAPPGARWSPPPSRSI